MAELVKIPELAKTLRASYNLRDDVPDVDIVNVYVKAYPHRKEQIDWNSTQAAPAKLLPPIGADYKPLSVQLPEPAAMPSFNGDLRKLIDSNPQAMATQSEHNLATQKQLLEQNAIERKELAKEQAEKDAALDSLKKEYEYVKSSWQKNGVGLQLPTPQEYTQLKSGGEYTGRPLRQLYLTPELAKILEQRKAQTGNYFEKAGAFRQLSSDVMEGSKAMMKPAQDILGAVGLADDRRVEKEMQTIAQNAEIEKRKKEIKDKAAKGETPSQEETKWLAENDKGFIDSVVEGAKEFVPMVKGLLTDHEQRKEFVSGVLDEIPSIAALTVATSGFGTIPEAVNAYFRIAKAMKEAARIEKAGGNAKKFMDDWKIAKDNQSALNRYKKMMTDNPGSAKAIMKDFAVNTGAGAAADYMFDQSQGGDNSIGGFLSGNAVLTGATVAAGKHGVRRLLDDKTSKDYVSGKTFDDATGSMSFGETVPGKQGLPREIRKGDKRTTSKEEITPEDLRNEPSPKLWEEKTEFLDPDNQNNVPGIEGIA